MINSGSGKQYLTYAIGEIALVVIGILIALQINNWNQNRVNRQFEKDYLKRFILDIERDTSLIRFIENGMERKEDDLKVVKSYLDDRSTILTDSVMRVLDRSHAFGSDLPNARLTGTIQEITSSGQLRLIRNTNLRNKITNFYSFWDHTYYRINNKRSDYPSLILQIIDRAGVFDDDPINKGKSLSEVLTEFEIENEFRLNFMKEVNYIYFTRLRIMDLKRKANDVIDSIKKELE